MSQQNMNTNSASNNDKKIYSLYYVLLLDAIKEYQHSLFNTYGERQWQAGKKLALVVREKSEREKIQIFINLTERNIQLENSGTYSTIAQRELQKLNSQHIYEEKAIELGDKIYQALDDLGYLKQGQMMISGREIGF